MTLPLIQNMTLLKMTVRQTSLHTVFNIVVLLALILTYLDFDLMARTIPSSNNCLKDDNIEVYMQ